MIKDQKDQRDLLNILSYTVFKRDIAFNTETDCTKMLIFSARHGVLPHLYKIPLEFNEVQLFKISQSYMQAVYFDVTRDKIIEDLRNLFFCNKIPYILFKGQRIKQLYPYPQLRTMGDTDIYVNRSDIDTVDKLLNEYGFAPMKKKAVHINEISQERVVEYSKNQIYIDVHLQMSLARFNKAHNAECLEDIWLHTEQVGQFEFNLTKEAELFYAFYHAAKHITRYGTGIRTILDIAVMLNSWRGALSFEMLTGYLVQADLFHCACWIFKLCEKWFSVASPYPEPPNYTEENLGNIEEMIWHSGTYGDSKNVIKDSLVIYKRSDFIKNDTTIRSFIFPPITYMRQHYPVLSRHGLLLPVCWIKRLLSFIAAKRLKFFKAMLGFLKDRKEIEKKEKLLDILEIGL